MFTISSSQYKRVQFHLHLCNFCCCTCKEFRKTKEFYVSISLLWYQLVKKRLRIYQFDILSFRFQIWKKICSKIFKRMKFQDNYIQEIVVSFLTGFLFLDYVNGVYTGKSVEGDRLVRVDASLTAVNTAQRTPMLPSLLSILFNKTLNFRIKFPITFQIQMTFLAFYRGRRLSY